MIESRRVANADDAHPQVREGDDRDEMNESTAFVRADSGEGGLLTRGGRDDEGESARSP